MNLYFDARFQLRPADLLAVDLEDVRTGTAPASIASRASAASAPGFGRSGRWIRASTSGPCAGSRWRRSTEANAVLACSTMLLFRGASARPCLAVSDRNGPAM